MQPAGPKVEDTEEMMEQIAHALGRYTAIGKEKEAEGPVTKSSVAQKLGDGPNIMRASDVGIGKSNGGG